MYVNVLQKEQESCVLVCMRKLNTSVACHIVNSTYDRAWLKNHKPKGFTNMIHRFILHANFRDTEKAKYCQTAKFTQLRNFTSQREASCLGMCAIYIAKIIGVRNTQVPSS